MSMLPLLRTRPDAMTRAREGLTILGARTATQVRTVLAMFSAFDELTPDQVEALVAEFAPRVTR